jgi:hypothetical protein
MTKPKRDGRSPLERARELRKLSGYKAHERSSEVASALNSAMIVVEAALRWSENNERGALDLNLALVSMQRPTNEEW